MNSTITILRKAKQFIFKNGIDLLFILLAVVYTYQGNVRYIKDPEIVFLNVGQGDAILVQQGTQQMLVDTGPDESVMFALSKYMPWYDREIEVLVLTHPHEDHIGGIYSILKKYKVGKILYNPVEYGNNGYNYLLENYSDILVDVEAGGDVRIGEWFGIIIYPFERNSLEERKKNINNESVVTLLYIKEKKILLMGDAEKEVEEELYDYSFLNNIFLLKAGHHCSRTSSHENFIQKLEPQMAICSCGEKNKFGHPSNETLEIFRKYNVQYILTYESGDVRYVF
ncbi:MAG: ComEC/Rec2 family competence protein [Candidatus Dojkabacteria bacterium]|jgi:competence protein ComEC